jgi:hypothetical protein
MANVTHSWAYGKGWPWTFQSIAKPRHAMRAVTLETALMAISRVAACRVGVLLPSSTPLDTPRCTTLHAPLWAETCLLLYGILRSCLDLLTLYALWAVNSSMACLPGQGWPLAGHLQTLRSLQIPSL